MAVGVVTVSRASAKAAAVGKRSPGTWARARWIAWSTASGTFARILRTLGTGSVKRRIRITCAVGPV